MPIGIYWQRIREKWKGNLVVKGVVSSEDALKLQSVGVDAIQVSSHWGASTRRGASPNPRIEENSKGGRAEMSLFFDCGIRSDEDIVKAYAMGSDFVFLGRPFSFAIAAGGDRGLQEMTNLLAEEISITLAQLGLRDIRDVNSEVFEDAANFQT